MPQALSTVSITNYTMKKSRAKRKKRTAKNTSISYNRRVFRLSSIVFLLFVGVVIFNLYLNLQLVEASFSLREISKKAEKIESETQSLETQIVSTITIERIKQAAESLDLQEVKNARFVKIPETGSLSLEK